MTHGLRSRISGNEAESHARTGGGHSNQDGSGPYGPNNLGSQLDNGMLRQEAKGATPSTGNPGLRGGLLETETGERTPAGSGRSEADKGMDHVPGGTV